MFEETVTYKGHDYDVVYVERYIYDPEDVECIEDTEELFFKYIEL